MAKKSRRPKLPIPAKKHPPRVPHRTPILWFSLILVIATLIAYEPLRHNEFVDYDTDDYVTENPHVNQGLTWASLVWAFDFPFDESSAAAHAANWHPLTWLSHILDCQLFQLNPWGHHLVNLLFHLFNTLLLFWVLQKITHAIWPAFFVAALFALHPLHVESVAWIAERKDLLSGFFWIMTIAFYFYYAKKPSFIRYLPVFISFALGLLAKPMLVTLPFILLLLDYGPLNRLCPSISIKQKNQVKPTPLYKLLLEKAPLIALAVASGIITFLVQQSGGAVKNTVSYPLDIRLFNALISYLNYLVKMIFPVNLAVLYPHPGSDIIWWQWLGSLLVLALVTFAVFFFARRHRYLVVGWLWYLGSLVPVIGLVQVGAQSHADRYTYIPLVGIFIMIAWGVSGLTQKWLSRSVVLTLVTVLVLLPLWILTRHQLTYWKDSVTLFEHTLAVTEKNYIMHHNLGRILAGREQNAEAQYHFEQALIFHPGYARAHNNLGVVLAKQGQYQLALESLEKALQLRGPDNPDSFNTYQNMAQSYAFLKEIPNAIGYSRLALKLKPDSYETLTNLAWFLATGSEAQFRDGPEAVALALRACQLTDNQWPAALTSLAAAYAETGQFQSAVDTAQKAIDLFHAQGLTRQADTTERQLKFYQGQMPYRDK